MSLQTAYELMTRYEQITRISNHQEIIATREEGQGIIETLQDTYGIWRGQDGLGKFVWYNAKDQIITKDQMK